MLATKKSLTLAAAKRIADAAEQEALKNKWNVVIAIVDDGGHLIFLQRMDNTQLASVEVAQQKAKGAAMFKRNTKALEDMVAGGRTVMMSLKGVVPVEGGVLLDVDGQVVGAIGVSGVTSPQDGQIAKAGADELANIAKG
ncbi:MAG: heme-binding protein [Bryobacteraceae bacterium]